MDKLPPGMVVAHKPESKVSEDSITERFSQLQEAYLSWKRVGKYSVKAKKAFCLFNDLLRQLKGHSKVQEHLCQNYQENWHKKLFITNTRKILKDANLICSTIDESFEWLKFYYNIWDKEGLTEYEATAKKQFEWILAEIYMQKNQQVVRTLLTIKKAAWGKGTFVNMMEMALLGGGLISHSGKRKQKYPLKSKKSEV